ncbi:MAG: phosphatase PAP2 family protein [Gemmatimonadota bacterium]|nr:phosphatase PAP2 family protein [Gemmatimonadota bacterium]
MSAGALRPAERLVLAYVVVTTILALLRWPRVPATAWVLGAHALILLLLWLLRRADPGSPGQAVRVVAPLLLLGAFYPAIDILNNFGAVAVHDAAIQHWELRLFGGEVSRTWWQAAPSRFWSTALHAVYFAYYPIVLGPPILFLARGRRAAAERSVLWLMATFLSCYLVFLLYPVAGPYYEYPRPDAAFLDNWAARLVYATLSKGSAYGAAFPSSHVAATLVAAAAAWFGSRKLGAVLAGPALLLTIGVVYCQMHYAVDAVAGVLVAGVVVLLGWRRERDAGTAVPRG